MAVARGSSLTHQLSMGRNHGTPTRTPFARCSAEDTSERLLHALPQPWVVCGGSESWFLQQGRMGSSGLRGAGASRSSEHDICVPKQGACSAQIRARAS